MEWSTKEGHPYPFGATWFEEGVNFCLPAPDAKNVSLILYLPEKITLPLQAKTGAVWHLLVKGLPDQFCYRYLIDEKVEIIDPFAKEMWSEGPFGEKSYTPFALARRPTSFDWQGVEPPIIAPKDLIIYEMHIRGFHKSYAGCIEKISYLKELGINAVELLPVMEFNEMEYARSFVGSRLTLLNYWGYSPINFFAPMSRYASKNVPGAAKEELQTLIREFHRNGIAVILDVVYNHTAEGGEGGPIYHFKELGPSTYYLQDEQRNYLNYSGTGNTLRCNQPQVQKLIIASLRHFVQEYQVDGFRFDLASILARDSEGIPTEKPPLIDAINSDPLLANTLLIAEPWDASGLYQVGSFPLHNKRWREWNGKYRDEVRRFMKGDAKAKNYFATRIAGSEDLFSGERDPSYSINYITCHDGFTLHDLVSYNEKHNQENGENNRDGFSYNDSWNCGVEGETCSPTVNKLRERQKKNMLLALFISQGIPMILMGDEKDHTQFGNNNAWCQDNEISYFPWEKTPCIYFFVKKLIQFRKRHPYLCQERFLTEKDIVWHGTMPLKPHWEIDDHFLGFTLFDELYVAFNANGKNRRVTLPSPPICKQWHLLVDTFQDSPRDFVEESEAKALLSHHIYLHNHTSILLKAW